MSGFVYLLNRNQSRACRLNGIMESLTMPRKPELCQSFADHVLYSNNELPPKVDLRPTMTAVEDQSKLGSCVANALAGAYEYLIKKSRGSDVDVSRLFIYYNARTYNNPSNNVTDTGCSMTDAIEALEEYGVCLESKWPYDLSKANAAPDNRAYESAKKFKITEALRVDIDLHQMKSCLAQGYPFGFGLRLFNSFDRAANNGVVVMPDRSEQGRSEHACHALLAVGYSDQSNAFIVRNSWGKHWGDNGYCYIPYEYMTNPQFCFDAWTVRNLASDDFGQDHWDQDDSVDYQNVNPEPYDDDDQNRSIEIFENNEEFVQDAKRFAEKVLNQFISLAF